MPSSVGHASVGIVLSHILPVCYRTRRRVGLGIALSMSPDVDALPRPFGYPDFALLGGHRGLTHSVITAGIAALLVSLADRRHASKRDHLRWAFYIGLVLATHGALDGLTRYGDGVAYFAPISMRRWKSAWLPLSNLYIEALVLWLPSCVYLVWHAKGLATTEQP